MTSSIDTMRKRVERGRLTESPTWSWRLPGDVPAESTRRVLVSVTLCYTLYVHLRYTHCVTRCMYADNYTLYKYNTDNTVLVLFIWTLRNFSDTDIYNYSNTVGHDDKCIF